uniref:Uncharacterized protein n=1 Tax=Elaeophora elaphi TaxID=1147741 RepID=A0A0R3RPF2_9BILA
MAPHFRSYIKLRRYMPPSPVKKLIKYSDLARIDIQNATDPADIIFQRLCIRQIRYSELNLEIFRFLID